MMDQCDGCGSKEVQVYEVAGMLLCAACIAPPRSAEQIVFVFDHAAEMVYRVVVPGEGVLDTSS